MTSMTLMSDVQDARALAYKIWLECRNGQTQYHCLAVDVRNIRNALEVIEEACSSQDTLSAEYATTLQDGVTSCSSALCILEFSLFALQRSRYSFNFSKGSEVLRNLRPVAVVILRKTLLSATADALAELDVLTLMTTSRPEVTTLVVHGPLASTSVQRHGMPASTLPNQDSGITAIQATSDHVLLTAEAPAPVDAVTTIEAGVDQHSASIVTMTTKVVTKDPASKPPPGPKPFGLRVDAGVPIGPHQNSVPRIAKAALKDDVAVTASPKHSRLSPSVAANPGFITELVEAQAKLQKEKLDADVELTCCTDVERSASTNESMSPNDPGAQARLLGNGLASSMLQLDDKGLSGHSPEPTHRNRSGDLPVADRTEDSEAAQRPSVPRGLQAPLVRTVADIPPGLGALQVLQNIDDYTKGASIAPTSRLVQRLRSNGRAPTVKSRAFSVSSDMPSEPASLQARPALSTERIHGKASGNASPHPSSSEEDLYASSRPTTPRVSAENVSADQRALSGKEHRSSTAQPALEVDQRSDEARASSQLSFRHSEDELLGLRTPRDHTATQAGPDSVPMSTVSPTVSSPQLDRRPPPPLPLPPRLDLVTCRPEKNYAGLHELDAPRTSSQDDDSRVMTGERVCRICHCWNNQLWPQAEAYLAEELESHLRSNVTHAARRLRHLLAVCASLQGHWQCALVLFVSVISPAVNELSDLDPADCAALWFLGDVYAILDRQAEALLAYCMALQGYKISGNAPHAIIQCLRSDQQFIGISRADFRSQWDIITNDSKKSASDTILNTNIFSQALVKRCFDAMALDSARVQLDSTTNRSRVRMLHQYDGNKAGSVYATEYRNLHHIAITPQMFEADAAWPIKYDPMFCIANVARGRIVERPCDLLEYISRNPGLDFTRPRAGVWALSRRARFKCDELMWLVGAVRACLEVMSIEWTESAKPDTSGLCFFARHSLFSSKVATMDYFTISLFRHSLHSKYSVAVCTDGIRSARINTGAKQPGSGVRLSKKRPGKFVYRYLKQAYAQKAETMASVPFPMTTGVVISKHPHKPATIIDAVTGVLEKSTFLATSESFKDKTTMLVIQPIGPSVDMQTRIVQCPSAIKKLSREVSESLKA
ncbi:hypothetical protein LTR95_009039 [Oleoguttula sp. CCFEE 5521]